MSLELFSEWVFHHQVAAVIALFFIWCVFSIWVFGGFRVLPRRTTKIKVKHRGLRMLPCAFVWESMPGGRHCCELPWGHRGPHKDGGMLTLGGTTFLHGGPSNTGGEQIEGQGAEPRKCRFNPPTPGFEACTREKGHDGPCAHHAATPSPSAHLLQFFEYSHLPADLQAVSKPFAELAERLAAGPRNPEATTALRKLLEAKDCAVRAALAH